MAKAASVDVLDALLAEIATATTLSVCVGVPSDVADITNHAIASVSLTPGDGNGDFTIANGDAEGRKITVEEQLGLTASAAGTPDHVVLDDGSVILFVSTCTSPVISMGNDIDLPAWKVTFGEPGPAIEILIVQETAHAHTAESPTTSIAFTLVVQDSNHAVASETPTLTQANVLAVQDALSTHTADNVTFDLEQFVLIFEENYENLGTLSSANSEWTEVVETQTVVDPGTEGIAAPPEGGNALRVIQSGGNNPFTQFYDDTASPVSWGTDGGGRIRQLSYLRVSSNADRRYMTMRTMHHAEISFLAFGTSGVCPRDGKEDPVVSGHFHDTSSFTIETASGNVGAYNQWPNMTVNCFGQNGTEPANTGDATYVGTRGIPVNQWFAMISDTTFNTFDGSGNPNSDGTYRIFIGQPGDTYTEALANPRMTLVWNNLITCDVPQAGIVIFQNYMFGADGTVYRAHERMYRSQSSQVEHYPARVALPTANVVSDDAVIDIADVISATADQWRIERRPTGGSWSTVTTVTDENDFPFTDNGPFTEDQEYEYSIISIDTGTGNESERSEITSGVTPNTGGQQTFGNRINNFNPASAGDWGPLFDGGGGNPSGQGGASLAIVTNHPAGAAGGTPTRAIRLSYSTNGSDSGSNMHIDFGSSLSELWCRVDWRFAGTTVNSILKAFRWTDLSNTPGPCDIFCTSGFSQSFNGSSTTSGLPGSTIPLGDWFELIMHIDNRANPNILEWWFDGIKRFKANGTVDNDNGTWQNEELRLNRGATPMGFAQMATTLNSGHVGTGTLEIANLNVSTGAAPLTTNL